MRFSILLACVCAVGCGANFASSKDPDGGGSGSGSGAGDISECNLDTDCAPAGTDCCACPTYAIPISDPAHVACEDVPCQPETCSDMTDVRAACTQGACVLTCAITSCDMTCQSGFTVDANGCLTCHCADLNSGSAECMVDTDCTRVEADCCGCALGGTDTAVPNGDVATHQQQLDCPMNPQCPGVDTCRTDLAPACVEGACALVPPVPVGECGLSKDPACATGETCDLNLDSEATDRGAGICGTPP